MRDSVYFKDMINTSQNLNPAYGYLWWLNGKASFLLPQTQFVFPGPLFPDAPSDMFAALGKNGQIINVVPSLGIVLVRMGNNPEGPGEITPLFNNNIWQLLNQVLCNLSVEEMHSPNIPGVRIYPNPVSDHLEIQVIESIEHYRVYVYSNTGQEVFSGEDLRTISTDGWDKGLYLLRLGFLEGSRTIRLIKN